MQDNNTQPVNPRSTDDFHVAVREWAAEVEERRMRFAEPETRNGVFVSADRKAAWKAILDILEVLIGIFDRHALRWSMCGGSLIGACREHGFVPWDDDIDVMLPRPDYERLQEILPRELPPHLFMQTSRTAPGMTGALMKVCDSRTTGIMPFFAERRFPMNYGLFVDILPIDPDPGDARNRRRLSKRGWNARVIRYYHFFRKTRGIVEQAKKLVAEAAWRILGGSDGLYEWRERPFRKMAEQQHDNWSIYPAHVGYIDRGHLKAEWLEEYIEVPFEYLMVKVLRHYDEALTQNYGDWRTPRSDASLHGELVLDAAVDFRTTLRSRFGWTDEELRRLPSSDSSPTNP